MRWIWWVISWPPSLLVGETWLGRAFKVSMLGTEEENIYITFFSMCGMDTWFKTVTACISGFFLYKTFRHTRLTNSSNKQWPWPQKYKYMSRIYHTKSIKDCDFFPWTVKYGHFYYITVNSSWQTGSKQFNQWQKLPLIKNRSKYRQTPIITRLIKIKNFKSF